MCLCFRLGWAIRPDSWLRFQEAISKCIHARCSRIIYSFACSLGWGKKCLTDCSHYSIQCILTGACPLKARWCFVVHGFQFLLLANSYPQQTTRPLDFFHYIHCPCTMYLRSLSLSYSVSSWTSFIIIIIFFFFFALNECDAISSQCNSLTIYSIRGVGVYLVGMLASAKVA